MLIITHEGVKIVFLPERAGALEALVDLARGKGFPGVDRFAKCITMEGLKQDMDVIRHHAPGDEAVALLVKIQQGVLDDLRALRLPQNTGTRALIQVVFDQTNVLMISCVLNEMFPFVAFGFWQRIRESEGYCLDESRLIVVRKIAAICPPRMVFRERHMGNEIPDWIFDRQAWKSRQADGARVCRRPLA